MCSSDLAPKIIGDQATYRSFEVPRKGALVEEHSLGVEVEGQPTMKSREERMQTQVTTRVLK